MGEIGEKAQCLLIATGQLTQYGGYPDDGFYRKGRSKQYEVLSAGKYSGTTSITVATKTDLISNNCVYDRRTKLMWSRYPSDGLGPAGDGKMPWTTDGSGHGIFAFVAAANAAKLAGYSDWRIPNETELANLRDMEQPDAAPDAVAFPGWPTSDWFWSSTTFPSSVDSAMIVHFYSGYVGADSKVNGHFVALVRGG